MAEGMMLIAGCSIQGDFLIGELPGTAFFAYFCRRAKVSRRRAKCDVS